METRAIDRLLNTFGILRTQVLAALVVPLEHEERRPAPRSRWRFDQESFDDHPGRIGRNGLGSLEVGGGDDGWDH